ncbi:MAG: ATPase, partial [Gammaproteobacteria bacterium]|nr:ATPase [Gammaproteobacteria bacterium]
MQEVNIHTDLDILIRARYPIIFVESFEENRVIKIVELIIGTGQQDENGKRIYLWSGTTGLTDSHGNPVKEGTEDPLIAMETIDESDRPMIIIFKDLHRYIEDIMVYRKLRDLHQNLKTTHKTIIIISPVLTIPIELQKVITVVSLP